MIILTGFKVAGLLRNGRDCWLDTTRARPSVDSMKTFLSGIANSYIFSIFQTIKGIGILRDAGMMIVIRVCGGLGGL